jgi:hypothetical protein
VAFARVIHRVIVQPHFDFRAEPSQGRRTRATAHSIGHVRAYRARWLQCSGERHRRTKQQEVPRVERLQPKARVVEDALEFRRERRELGRGKAQNAAAIEMQAREAGNQVDGGRNPNRGFRHGCRRGGCRHRRCGQFTTAQPACEPRTPPALERDMFSETCDVPEPRQCNAIRQLALRRFLRQVEIG